MIIYNGFFRTTGFWRPTKDKYIILHTVPPDMLNLWNKRNNSLNIMMWSNTVAVIKSIIKPESTHWAMNTVWSKYQIQTKPMHMSTYFVCLCNFIKNNIVHVLLFGLCYSRKYLGNQHREKMALSVNGSNKCLISERQWLSDVYSSAFVHTIDWRSYAWIWTSQVWLDLEIFLPEHLVFKGDHLLARWHV